MCRRQRSILGDDMTDTTTQLFRHAIPDVHAAAIADISSFGRGS